MKKRILCFCLCLYCIGLWAVSYTHLDLTMGNFCNVDLEYPLKKELSRKKRMSAITQAHVAYCHRCV